MKISVSIAFLLGGLACSSVNCTPISLDESTLEKATDVTCGDSNSTVVYYEGYSPGRSAHMIQQHSSFVNSDTQGEDLQIQSAVFRAWNTPQTGTISFWRLAAEGNPTPDYVFAMSSTTSAPVVSGFPLSAGIMAYVYPTQICGSIPLFVLSFSSARDHYYTVDAVERQNLIVFGWADQGIAAYVLPV